VLTEIKGISERTPIKIILIKKNRPEKMIIHRRLNHHSSSSGISRLKISKRLKIAAIASCLFILFLLDRESLSEIRLARMLKICRSRSNANTKSGYEETEEEKRQLEKYGQIIDRFLGYDGLDLCDTIFPDSTVNTVVIPADSAEAQEEPDFLVSAPDENSTVSSIESDDGEILLVPVATGNDELLDESERELITSYEAQFYNATIAIDKASTEDQDTIAYLVPLTCCEDFQQVSGTTGYTSINSGAELYEASAVLKTEVCQMTEQAATNRRLGKTRKLRKLEEIGQLSAAEMDYTM